eukprot:TRINITY_DN5200_c0_g2_i2.p2 TRINITY_DN5200_c0_g2~~TRINITY_DN5200_c0_g2_i2.p2  ORF type:complete len:223 (-),score=45.57 TRINITY_DN5200_c0_g2_i2:1764-2432(-)
MSSSRGIRKRSTRRILDRSNGSTIHSIDDFMPADFPDIEIPPVEPVAPMDVDLSQSGNDFPGAEEVEVIDLTLEDSPTPVPAPVPARIPQRVAERRRSRRISFSDPLRLNEDVIRHFAIALGSPLHTRVDEDNEFEDLTGGYWRRRRTMKEDVVDLETAEKATTVFSDISCAICLCGIQDVTSTNCGHLFCEGCILDAIRYSSKCPVCRRPLTSKNIHPIFL